MFMYPPDGGPLTSLATPFGGGGRCYFFTSGYPAKEGGLGHKKELNCLSFNCPWWLLRCVQFGLCAHTHIHTQNSNPTPNSIYKLDSKGLKMCVHTVFMCQLVF